MGPKHVDIERGKPFYYTLLFMVISGQIPMDFKESTKKKYIVHNATLKTLFIIFNFGASIAHLLVSAMGGEDVDISEDIAFAYGGFSSLCLDFLFMSKWRKWSELLHEITRLTEFGKDPGYDDLIRRLNRMSAGYILYCTVVVMIYGTNALYMASSCRRRNQEMDLHEICGTFSTIWLPFEVNGVVSTSIFLLQVLLFYFNCLPSALMCVLVWEAVAILILHTENLKKYLEVVFDVNSYGERRARIRFCVRYHEQILRLGKRLSFVTKYSSGVISILAVLALSCIGNQVLNSKPFGAICYLIAYLVALFWVCHAGQKIKDETFSVKDAAYAAKWYKADAGSTKDMMFVIARCQIPVCIETLPFGILDYALFLLIIKTSYSYLTLLSQTT